MNGSGQTALVGSPREVEISAIERELAGLWREAAPSQNGADAVLKACSLNFIVLSEKSSQLDEIAAMVGDVTAEHPGRVFLVETHRQAPEPALEAWVSARCSLPLPGEKQVCCEQITLVAAGEEIGKAPSVVTSLLVPDVPTVILWKAPLAPGNTLLGQFLKIADRVLIDSSEHCDPERLLQVWGEFLGLAEEHVSLCDLAWTHITPWRTLVANAFQPLEIRPSVYGISSVIIQYSSSLSPPHSGLSQALLLISWLAERLSWTVQQPILSRNATTKEGVFSSRGDAVKVRLEQVSPPAKSSGQIESVGIDAVSGMNISWAMRPGREAVEFRRKLPGMAAVREMIPLSNQSEAALVALELEVLQRDVVYERSMVVLRSLLRGSGQ